MKDDKLYIEEVDDIFNLLKESAKNLLEWPPPGATVTQDSLGNDIVLPHPSQIVNEIRRYISCKPIRIENNYTLFQIPIRLPNDYELNLHFYLYSDGRLIQDETEFEVRIKSLGHLITILYILITKILVIKNRGGNIDSFSFNNYNISNAKIRGIKIKKI